jgi:cellulose biosynthesis protein BcsS
VRGVVVLFAAVVAAGLAFCGTRGAQADTTTDGETAHFLLHGGFDLWRNGGFGHGGLLWSPDGLKQEGFTLKALLGAGSYRYRAGTSEITGWQYLASALPGWRFKDGTIELTLFGGLDLQQHQFSPDDRANRVRGFSIGARGGFDLWFEPLPSALMITTSVSASTIGKDVWVRGAAGMRAFDLWLGPESIFCGDGTYRQMRFGVHATGLRTDIFEWSAGFGWVTDSDKRSGMYGRLGVLVRK